MDLYSCAYCGKVGSLSRCSRCKSVFYCSKEHQTHDWKKHKLQCGDISRASAVRNISSPSSSNNVPGNIVANPSNFVPTHKGKHERSSRSHNTTSVHNTDRNTSPITYEGSSENEIINARTEDLDPTIFELPQPGPNDQFSNNLSSPQNLYQFSNYTDVQNQYTSGLQGRDSLDFSEIRLDVTEGLPPFHHRNELVVEPDILKDVCRNVITDMNNYGVCVVDDFLGHERGEAVLDEVKNMYQTGVFKDGQLVSNKMKKDLKTIRGDQIVWIDGKESFCRNIGQLISQVDKIIMEANRMANNGKLGNYTINGRTKAMVACYPGHGSHYVKHVDNPNRDGRCITAIYYLNKDWDVQQNGGLLRIFPEGWQDQVADIAPLFDRILFFWSDRRNPHEVQPAYKTRYAITLWYFDAAEREEACRRYQRERGLTAKQEPS